VGLKPEIDVDAAKPTIMDLLAASARRITATLSTTAAFVCRARTRSSLSPTVTLVAFFIITLANA
jgi:hypothetical protein